MDRGWLILLGSLVLLGVMIGPAYADGELQQDPVELEPARAELVAETNALRTSHGLDALARDDQLDTAATAHASRMASQEELSHSADWRRAQAECRGGEVVAYTYLRETIQQEYGEIYIDSGEALGEALYQQWHHSARHNDLLMAYNADRAGVGLVKTSDGSVYAAMWVC